jgi:O-antigen ligase
VNLIHTYQDSVACRWLSTSATGRVLSHPPPKTLPMLEGSLAIRYFREAPAVDVLLAVTVATGVLLSFFLGKLALSAMLLLFLAARYYPVVALALTPALLIWAPRLPVAVIGDEVFFLRLDQAAIAGMLWASALGRVSALRTPPAHTALLIFLMALPVSMMAGVAQGTLETPLSGLLYLAQWLTWYGLFVAAYSLGPRLGPSAVYTWALPLIALAAYGLAEQAWPYYEVPGVRYRTFERGLFPGQANHAGGLFALAAVCGLALTTESRHRLLGLSLAALSTLALVPTGSRSGLLAWGGGMVAMVLIHRPSLRWWLLPMAIPGLFAIPVGFWYRVSAPGSSMYDRLVAWKSALSTVADYPILGLGTGARHRSFYDSQYLMTLAESGIVGLVLFLILLVLLARSLGHIRMKYPAATWMPTAALGGIAALAIHSMATGSFIVTLIGGPFFWLAGVALSTGSDTS